MSGEPANFRLEDAARWRERRRPSWATPPGPIPTLGTLQKSSAWWWVYCESCQRRKATALVPLIIRWGADTSSDRLRRSARCVECGHKGATLQHPGWTNSIVGFEPFPVDTTANVAKCVVCARTIDKNIMYLRGNHTARGAFSLQFRD
jgi:hypothetical protein